MAMVKHFLQFAVNLQIT